MVKQCKIELDNVPKCNYYTIMIKLKKQTVNIQLDLLEIWKPIPGFFPYKISTFGRIQKNDEMKTYTRKGYQLLYICNKSTTIHALVALTFIGPRPQNLVINHIDGNPKNNRLDNLEYLTRAGNAYHGLLITNFSILDYDQKKYETQYKKEQKKVKQILNQIQKGVNNDKKR